MGFSVSGEAAIVFAGLFVVASILYGAASNNVERLQEAGDAQRQDRERVADTAVSIASVSLIGTGCTVEVLANNTGSTDLTVNGTDLLLDGEYQQGWERDARVDGDASTDMWLPGEQLNVTVGGLASAPDRVKLVTGPGVSAQTTVGGLLC